MPRNFYLTLLVRAAALAAPKLNDPQIATVALTAHQIDIDRGKLAIKHTKNAEVKQFAEQMADDHDGRKEGGARPRRQARRQARAERGDQVLKDGRDQGTAKAEEEKGAAFDKDYIDTEVAYHEAVIGALKNTLIPGAQNAGVEDALAAGGSPPWKATCSTRRWCSRRWARTLPSSSHGRPHVRTGVGLLA